MGLPHSFHSASQSRSITLNTDELRRTERAAFASGLGMGVRQDPPRSGLDLIDSTILQSRPTTPDFDKQQNRDSQSAPLTHSCSSSPSSNSSNSSIIQMFSTPGLACTPTPRTTSLASRFDEPRDTVTVVAENNRTTSPRCVKSVWKSLHKAFVERRLSEAKALKDSRGPPPVCETNSANGVRNRGGGDTSKNGGSILRGLIAPSQGSFNVIQPQAKENIHPDNYPEARSIGYGAGSLSPRPNAVLSQWPQQLAREHQEVCFARQNDLIRNCTLTGLDGSVSQCSPLHLSIPGEYVHGASSVSHQASKQNGHSFRGPLIPLRSSRGGTFLPFSADDPPALMTHCPRRRLEIEHTRAKHQLYTLPSVWLAASERPREPVYHTPLHDKTKAIVETTWPEVVSGTWDLVREVPRNWADRVNGVPPRVADNDGYNMPEEMVRELLVLVNFF